MFYPRTLGLLILLFFLVSFARELTVFNIIIRSNSNLHREMTKKLVRAKIIFFDSNPIGRIITRFSKDMAVLDLIMPNFAIVISYGIFRAFSVSVSLCIVNYWLIIPLVLIVSYFIYIVKHVTRALIDAQRLDSIVRGPIHSLFAMTVNGLISIRAYDQLEFFKRQFLNE